jgi:hypothetical protein
MPDMFNFLCGALADTEARSSLAAVERIRYEDEDEDEC